MPVLTYWFEYTSEFSILINWYARTKTVTKGVNDRKKPMLSYESNHANVILH